MGRGAKRTFPVGGHLGELLATMGPMHVVERKDGTVWFERTVEFERMPLALGHALRCRLERESSGLGRQMGSVIDQS